MVREKIWLEVARAIRRVMLLGAKPFPVPFLIPVYSTHIYLPMKMEQSVPKRRHINSRRRVITQKKAYNNNIFSVRQRKREFKIISMCYLEHKYVTSNFRG